MGKLEIEAAVPFHGTREWLLLVFTPHYSSALTFITYYRDNPSGPPSTQRGTDPRVSRMLTQTLMPTQLNQHNKTHKPRIAADIPPAPETQARSPIPQGQLQR
ncbi:hypothetical protein CGMCC3_g16788 [Colletotrichum fructicola]|nr:uncharacterized protein CGMCC3_g16788 [Colletotrichum fructicola]KAE9567086.1 hypothetical protein CGMCC3_g16788 [Colletotrichum fructicola]